MVQPLDRARRIAIEGSPTFYYSNSQIAASGLWSKEFEGNTPEAKYLPFDTCVVSNSSNSDIKITLGAHEFIVTANTVKTITDVAFNRFEIENLDASNSIAAGKIRVGVSLSPLNIDKAVRQEAYKNWRNFLGIRI